MSQENKGKVDFMFAKNSDAQNIPGVPVMAITAAKTSPNDLMFFVAVPNDFYEFIAEAEEAIINAIRHTVGMIRAGQSPQGDQVLTAAGNQPSGNA